ncbi:actin-related protein 5 [Anolis carolinensis]|uniref:Actin-related protein 5 n=1 Tax=Anolis carolinensis TaxID=28377 RepID=G1KPJ5_ANOCA|nr:PREDICTED: actin-related protein 5 [Anolis carolinensis]|eukprot:XP_003220642.1 PREDICTED: actin-related protein 5 [Anolis carolinensis]
MEEAGGGGDGGVFAFRDARWEPDPALEFPPCARSPAPAPLVLDNGSYQLRLGWACADPTVPAEPLLRFRSLVARSRGARGGGAGPETQVGNDLGSPEPLRWLLRSPFDRNVPVQMELQELLLDHGLQRLGLGLAAQGCVDHPIVITEAVCNPLYSRQMMSELLFECYQVPKVSYGVDSLYSFYHNKRQGWPCSGLIISSGYQCTHILPILDGRLDARNCKRINLGGCQATMYLQRLLQLKYPGHFAAITLSRVEEILHEHSYVAEDYKEEMQKWRSPEYYENNVHKMQLPFSNKLLGSTFTSEEKQERRQQQLRRLQELNARRREEKLQLDQERLDRLLYVQELLEDGHMDQFHKALVELNMDSAEELQSYIHKLNVAIEQTKQKILQAEVSAEVDVVDSKPEIPDLDPLGGEQAIEDVESMNEFEPLFAEEQPEAEKPVTTVQPVFNLAEYHQLFIGTERIRVPEILFQPSLIGEEQAGIAETMQLVLDRYPKEQQEKLVQNVFLTGGNVMYPGMKARICKELLEMRPFQSSFQVHLASNPVLDAWYGARAWALEYMNQEEGWITRKDYEEKGGEYLQEHCASNVYVPIRLPKQTPRTAETLASTKAPGTVTSNPEQT